MPASAKHNHLSVLILLSLLSSADLVCAEDYFEPAFVTDPSGKRLSVDLTPFRKSAYLPGTYHVDIFINDNYVDTRDINFTASDGNSEELIPCLPDTLLIQYGIKADNYLSDNHSGQCYDRVISLTLHTASYHLKTGLLCQFRRLPLIIRYWINLLNSGGMTGSLRYLLIIIYPAGTRKIPNIIRLIIRFI